MGGNDLLGIVLQRVGMCLEVECVSFIGLHVQIIQSYRLVAIGKTDLKLSCSVCGLFMMQSLIVIDPNKGSRGSFFVS